MNTLEKEYQWAKRNLRVMDVFAVLIVVMFRRYIHKLCQIIQFFWFVVLAVSHLLWDLSSPMRD